MIFQTFGKRKDRLKQGSALPKRHLKTIQRGTLAYTYKGVPTLKNPFDWALYPLLLWETRPATIVEIGSNRGGSALWFADTMRNFSIPCHVHSIDLKKVSDIEAPGVTFHAGNARDLSATWSADFMRSLARPLLVIEDADHQAVTTLAVLEFFDAWLKPGEYIVVEDGIVVDMGIGKSFGGGPCAAIEQFLGKRGDSYVIDTKYCDWFGQNVTWNVNGFLRRVS
jgi:cephalosporin hydroxylase